PYTTLFRSEVRRGAVAGHRYVPHHGDAQQGLDVRIVRLRLQRVPEEDQTVDVALGDSGANLLIATQRSALELVDSQPELLLQQMAGGAGGVQLVVSQELAIEASPLEQRLFLVIVGHQGD